MLIKCMCTKSRYNDPKTKSLSVLIFSQRSTFVEKSKEEEEKSRLCTAQCSVLTHELSHDRVILHECS